MNPVQFGQEVVYQCVTNMSMGEVSSNTVTIYHKLDNVAHSIFIIKT